LTRRGGTGRNGAQVAVVNPDRFLPSRQLIRQQLDAGRLGQPGLVRIHRWEHPRSERDASVPGADMARDADTALWLMGASPELVYALERGGEGEGASAGRSTQVHLGFAGGGMALLDYTNQLPAGDGYRSLSLIGSTGAAYADDHQNAQLLYRGGRAQAVPAAEDSMQVVALVQDFVAALAEGRDLSPSVSGWRRALAVVAAARRSIQTRQAITLEDR
jgi:predicted dehydrogenase